MDNVGRMVGFALNVLIVLGGVYFLTRPGTTAPSQTFAGPTSTSVPSAETPIGALSAQIPTAEVTQPTPSSTPTIEASPTPVVVATEPPPPDSTAVASPSHVIPVPASPTAIGPPGAINAVELVLRPGANSQKVAQRILGPNAVVQRAPVGGAVQSTQVARDALTWQVPVPRGSEQAALLRAQHDPDVQRARLVSWPP